MISGGLCFYFFKVHLVRMEGERRDGEAAAQVVDQLDEASVHIDRPLRRHLLGLTAVNAGASATHHAAET